MSSSHRQKTYLDGYINSATIKYDDALRLIKHSGETVGLKIVQKVEERKAYNLIVDIEGSNPDDNMTYLVAHYDSVARSPGATDNGGGTVSLLKIAEHFSKHKPKRDLRIIFFSGEELGLLGSQHYVNSHEDEMKNKSSLVLNIDVSGDPIARSRIAVTGSKQLLGYSDGVLKETGLCIDHSLDIYSSDQMPFTIHEIPGISVARFAGKGQFVGPGTNLASVYSQEVMEVVVSVEDNKVRWLDLNKKKPPVATVSGSFSGKESKWIGKVKRVAAQLDERNRLPRIIIEIPDSYKTDNPPLIPNMFVQVKMEGIEIENSFLIPEKYIHDKNIYIEKDGLLEIRKIEVSAFIGENTVITGGLKENEKVVVSPLSNPVNGMKVKGEEI